MKIYLNKDTGALRIVYSKKDNENAGVKLIKDRAIKKQENMFGNIIERYLYHWSSPNEGYGSMFSKLENKKDGFVQIYPRKKVGDK